MKSGVRGGTILKIKISCNVYRFYKQFFHLDISSCFICYFHYKFTFLLSRLIDKVIQDCWQIRQGIKIRTKATLEVMWNFDKLFQQFAFQKAAKFWGTFAEFILLKEIPVITGRAMLTSERTRIILHKYHLKYKNA